MNPHLFVYGSLMSTAGHRNGRAAAREARLIGAATIQGRLYRVSWYPGVVDSARPRAARAWRGLRARRPGQALAWLDAYEGIVPGEQEAGEYGAWSAGAACGGRGDRGLGLSLQKDVTGLPPVPDGRWTAAAR